MTAAILGLGTAIPSQRIDVQTAATFASLFSCSEPSQTRKVEALYRRSGVKTRGSVLLESDEERVVSQSFYPAATGPADRGPTTSCRGDRYATEAPLLALESASQALFQSGVDADSITHLVTVSCTGFSAPGIDIALIDGLKLPATTQRVQVGFMGCHGAINGLRTAQGLVAAEPGARVLLCSVELCSLHYQYGYDSDRIVSGALFADGSASLVIAAADDQATSMNGSHGGVSHGGVSHGGVSSTVGRIGGTGSCLVPASRDAMTWLIGDNGYEMTLSATVPGLIERHLREFLSEWLGRRGESIESIGGWAVHPGGARILTSVESALGLGRDALAVSRDVLAEHGNMSSATMLFIIERFRAAAQPKPWLMLGFGPGLEIEVALIH